MVDIVIKNDCVKKQRNIRKKSDENLQKRRFPVYFQYFRPEKVFLKNRTRPYVLSNPNMHLWAKNQKKLMVKSWENGQKPVFTVYFRHFRPEKNVFSKIGLRHILDIAILHLCAKFHKVQLQKFKKYGFSGENRVFRRFLESSGFKKKFYWQLNYAWWWALLLIIFWAKKQRNKRMKSNENLQKRRFPAYFRYFRTEKNFSQKWDSAMFWALLTRIFCAKNQKKLMMKSRENVKKPVFPAYFWHFRLEMNFFRKSGSVTF